MTFITNAISEPKPKREYGRIPLVVLTALAMASVPVTSRAQTAYRAATQNIEVAVAAQPFPPLATENFLPASSSSSSSADAALPDTPEGQVHAGTAAPFDKTSPVGKTPAPRYAKDITPQEIAYQPITVRDKIIIGGRDLYSIENFAAIISSAGYEQLVNGEPNYGNNSTAFGKRVGAAAIRETAQGAFTDMIFHPIFHTDSRYYIEGNQYNFFHRTAYAVSRVFITRTDSGKSTLNAALLLGYAGASGLNNAYYPQINRNFKDNATGYGGSLGGAMIGFFFSEFSSDLLHIVHKGGTN